MTKKKIQEDKYKGIITDIYHDEKNHYVWTFKIRDNMENFRDIAEQWPYSWEYASIGDSIIKL